MRLAFLATAIFGSALWCATLALAQEARPQPPATFPGPIEGGFLLPNGWRVTPVGQQVLTTDLPLNILTSADGKYALVATSGYNAHELTVVEIATGRKVTKEAVRQSWFGLVQDVASGQIWWSGGGEAVLHSFALSGEKLEARPSYPPTATRTQTKVEEPPPGFRSGICLDSKNGTLFSLTIIPKGGNKSFAWGDATTDENSGGGISRHPVKGETGDMSAPCGVRPYDVVLGRNNLLYVSDWAKRVVLVVDPAYTALFPQSPEGTTPDALAIEGDGETLFVANADNNCVAVIDIEAPRRSQVKGFIPTGWYPTSLAVSRDDKHLLIGVGKGNVTQSNKPEDARLAEALARPAQEGGYKRIPFPHVGTTLSGALSIVPMPNAEQLKKYTDQVYRNCPYSDQQLTLAPSSRKTAIPTKVGDASPIKHVIYIIKENRTYDQVFSDIPRGRRDPSLLMFGEEVTPNHHKLANEYVLLDNLYCNGHVSADGHPWSTMAYNTDYIARNWALTYSRRLGIDDDDDGDLTRAPSGYIWDSCKRHGLSYRSYGEYGGRVSQPDGTFKMDGRVPGLIGHVSPKYDLRTEGKPRMRDTDNVAVFLEEFREYEKNGDLPRFIVMSLGEDHTQGTTPGAPTPQACVASNDLALGRLVEGVSKSKYWPQIAIFVIEDDAQNGCDSVDAHRTIGLVISPYVRRGALDSTQYATVSMLRTMELILGLPPLSQFDASANPMFNCFTDTPDLTPYQHVEPVKINLNARNERTAYGAERSQKMDFTEYDKIDDFELNEILWRSIKGADAPIPPAVRRAIAYRGVEVPPGKKDD